jgi:hypothetical protein
MFNKISPTQAVQFWGRSMLKLNPEIVLQIPEQIILVQNFTAVLMAQRPGLYLLIPFGRNLCIKNGKIGKLRICPPPTLHRFSRSIGRIKKQIVRKCSLCLSLLESKMIFFFFNHWPSYERSREIS